MNYTLIKNGQVPVLYLLKEAKVNRTLASFFIFLNS